MKIGSIIAGKFRIERVIGRGAMGVVLEAMDMTLGRRIAVKLILPQHAEDPELRGRFIREASAMTRLASEHVARVHEVGELDDGMLFLAMEFLEGQSLEQLIQGGGPLPAGDAVDLLLEALDAVAEAHSLGLVHRDLKPSNMFLAVRKGKPDPILKVLDFGIVKDQASTAKLTATGTLPGTPAYMAPEQVALQEELIDARADVWSLGVTLYELLTGEIPFTGQMNVMLTRIRSEAAPRIRARRPDVAPELEAIIDRCLSKHPADRFRNAGELAAALDDLRARGLVRSERGAERNAVATVINANRSGGARRETADTVGEDSFGSSSSSSSSSSAVFAKQQALSPRSSRSSTTGRVLPFALSIIGLCMAAGLVLALQRHLPSDPDPIAPTATTATSAPTIRTGTPSAATAILSTPAITASAVVPQAIPTATAMTTSSSATPKRHHVKLVSARNTGDTKWRTWINQHRARIEACAAAQTCTVTLALRLTKADGKMSTTIQGAPSASDTACIVQPSLVDCMTDLTKDAVPGPDVCPDPSDCRADVLMAFD